MSVKSKLKYSLFQVLKHDGMGSLNTKYDRRSLLLSFIKDINELGFKIIHINDLKTKHVAAAVALWQKNTLSNSTIKNRLSALRRLAEFIKKPTLVPTNNQLHVGARKYKSDINRAVVNPDFSRITNSYIKASLELQRVFGLRREESLKIKPHMADKGDKLELMPSWCKGGRGRTIPIRTQEQRDCLEQAKYEVGEYGNSLIPVTTNYIKHRYVYCKQTMRGGLSNLHGLRHAYAQARYKELTGWEAPINGGPKSKELTPAQKEIDHAARMILTEELGHGRAQIVANYISS
jgi:site-specific recombinase XerC